MTTPLEALAVIDGALIELGRAGARSRWHEPLATAVVEFRRGPLRTYVREHPFGLLPGMTNLYCLDGAHRLQWMAEWPDADDPCGRIVDEVEGVLLVESEHGRLIRLDATTGKLLRVDLPVAIAG